MENKINVATILKDKPQGTKLYNWLYNTNVELNSISTTDKETAIWRTKQKDINTTTHFYFSKLGTMRGCLDGLQILLPSKEMRDWRKFSWKKGDLLINSCGFQCLFKEWASDDYTKFNGCYSNSRDGYEDVSNAETAKFDKLDNNIAYGYVREIERKLGGILNLTTLEIEKQYEFKDGDIVVYGKSVAICRKIYKHTLSFYVSLNEMFGLLFADEVESSEEYRFATEEEKQQLFDALEKEGKAWDAEKKQIVDLKPKCEFKPMDLCLMRYAGRHNGERWELCQYAYMENRVSPIGSERDFYHSVGGRVYEVCIPYNEETRHLLGTTDNWEGGDG